MENFLKMEAIFSQNSPQNRTLETSTRHKNSEKGPTFSSKISKRVDIETLWWHTPVRKYHEFPPLPGYGRCTQLLNLNSKYSPARNHMEVFIKTLQTRGSLHRMVVGDNKYLSQNDKSEQ